MNGEQRYADFALDFQHVMDIRDLSLSSAAKIIGCGEYAVRCWLGKKGISPSLPGGKYAPRVLEEFGLDSRDYGGNWRCGFGGAYKIPKGVTHE